MGDLGGIILLFAIEFAVLVVLAFFESIDIVQQLQREVLALQQENERVEKQRDEMNKFWKEIQGLTELWLYRTMPRMDLFKELHSHLEETNQKDLINTIVAFNGAVENIESRL